MRLPNLELDFILETDASLFAVGAVLKQYFGDTELVQTVSFFNRELYTTKRNYSIYELEIVAVVKAVKHLRVYLLGIEFLLCTDHRALVNLLKRELPSTTRVQRLILRLSDYTFWIEYQRESANTIADVLSNAVRIIHSCTEQRRDWRLL